MKKYGGGSYFPSGAPGREERREEDYPQGENQIWIEKTKKKTTKNTKKERRKEDYPQSEIQI